MISLAHCENQDYLGLGFRTIVFKALSSYGGGSKRDIRNLHNPDYTEISQNQVSAFSIFQSVITIFLDLKNHHLANIYPKRLQKFNVFWIPMIDHSVVSGFD